MAVRCASSSCAPFPLHPEGRRSFSSIHASVSSSIFAGVRTSCNAPPRTLPETPPALVHLSSVSLLDSIGDSSDLNQLNTWLIPLPIASKTGPNRSKVSRKRGQPFHNPAEHPGKKCPDGIPVFPDKNGSSGKRSHDKTNRTEQRPDSASQKRNGTRHQPFPTAQATPLILTG